MLTVVESLVHRRRLLHLWLGLTSFGPMFLGCDLEKLGLLHIEVFHVLTVQIRRVLDIIFLRALRHSSFLHLCAFLFVRFEMELAAWPVPLSCCGLRGRGFLVTLLWQALGLFSNFPRALFFNLGLILYH